jgi:hypothetical protein
VWLAADEETCVCLPGQSVTVDTAGHCCWSAQAWSISRGVCVGIPECPAGLVASADACVAAAPPEPGSTPEAPAPAPAPAPVSAPAPAAEPEHEAHALSGSAALAVDLSTVGQGLGAVRAGVQVTAGWSFLRTPALSLGMGLGLGGLSSVPGSPTTSWVVYAPGYLQLGVRLGFGSSELLMRGGAAPAYVSTGASGLLVKVVAGATFVLRWPGGSALVGFDLYLLKGVAHTLTVGYAF